MINKVICLQKEIESLAVYLGSILARATLPLILLARNFGVNAGMALCCPAVLFSGENGSESNDSELR